MTQTMTQDQPSAASARANLQRRSVLAMLNDSPRPLSTAELEAAHGQFLTGRIYSLLRGLEDAGRVVRQHCLRTPAGRTVFWWLPNRAFGACAVPDCSQPGMAFVPPRFEIQTTYRTNEGSGVPALLWRDVVEVPGTGGWVCDDDDHQHDLLVKSLKKPSPSRTTRPVDG